MIQNINPSNCLNVNVINASSHTAENKSLTEQIDKLMDNVIVNIILTGLHKP